MVSNTISTLPLPGSSHSAMVRWWRWTPPTRWRQSPVASRGGSNSTPHSCDRQRRAAPLVARCAATPRLLRFRASRHAPTREFALYWIQVSPATGVCCDPATGACKAQSQRHMPLHMFMPRKFHQESTGLYCENGNKIISRCLRALCKLRGPRVSGVSGAGGAGSGRRHAAAR